jgi:transposase-like protein
MAIPGVKCPSCGSTKIWKVGFTPTKAGKKLRGKCTECATSFYLPKPKAPRVAKNKTTKKRR